MVQDRQCSRLSSIGFHDRLLRCFAPWYPIRRLGSIIVKMSISPDPGVNPAARAERAVRLLHQVGWRLVGDSPDRSHFADARQRIASIIDTSRALVAVLPFDGSKQPECTSPWIMDESPNCLRSRPALSNAGRARGTGPAQTCDRRDFAAAPLLCLKTGLILHFSRFWRTSTWNSRNYPILTPALTRSWQPLYLATNKRWTT